MDVHVSGGRFEEVPPDQFRPTYLPPHASQTSYLEHFKEEKMFIVESGRKYDSKLKDQDEEVVDGTYEQIIPEHSYNEHSKRLESKIQEIYDHTTQKVHQLQDRAVSTFNKDKTYRQDLDEQLKTSLNESIAFPVKYKPPPQFLEIK